MQNLLESRRTLQGNQSPIKLQNLSPEKYGKGAYAELTYTPSKLADNKLYKEVATLKKYQEGNGKRRQSQALNTLFQDRLDQLRIQKDGIESTLIQQINMYKKLLQQSQTKYQMHIKEIQSSFREEISQIIDQKQEQAKYAQAQKQLLEGRIEQLEKLLASHQQMGKQKQKQIDTLNNTKQKLEIKLQNITNNLRTTEQSLKKIQQKGNQMQDQLKRKLQKTEYQLNKKIKQQAMAQQKELQQQSLLHKAQLQKMENKRQAENYLKNQQIKDIQAVFDEQAERLTDIIRIKENKIHILEDKINLEKQKTAEMANSYEKQITNLSRENAHLVHDLGHYKDELSILENQTRSLRSLLKESSDQIQVCRNQYLRISNERDILRQQIRYTDGENRALYQISKMKEMQAQDWKKTAAYTTRAYF